MYITYIQEDQWADDNRNDHVTLRRLRYRVVQR